jgi:multisubunit Na+/H+ antiporter MnhB subunit
MKPLSKAGWISIGVAAVLFLIAFTHYNGLINPAFALTRMIASAFWGGIVLASLFIALMAVLFLSA